MPPWPAAYLWESFFLLRQKIQKWALKHLPIPYVGFKYTYIQVIIFINSLCWNKYCTVTVRNLYIFTYLVGKENKLGWCWYTSHSLSINNSDKNYSCKFLKTINCHSKVWIFISSSSISSVLIKCLLGFTGDIVDTIHASLTFYTSWTKERMNISGFNFCQVSNGEWMTHIW